VIVALEIETLAVRRGERRLFDDLSLTLAAGEALTLGGANGAGKTTLLRAIAGLIAPSAGTIGFAGVAGPLDPDDARRADLHLVGHLDALKTTRTAGDELAFQAAWCGGDAASAAAAAETLGLTRLLGLAVRQLSAGQRRRLALARLLAAPRKLWLLDEPLAPLDAAHRALLGELMARHLDGGGLIVAATHDPLPLPARRLDL
jgi:heme exporter protein A